MPGEERLAELIGGLSLATDLAAGLPLESALRTCLIAVRLGRALGLTGDGLRDVYFTGLLRFIGCTALSHEAARDWSAGEDQQFLGVMAPVDPTSLPQVVSTAVRQLGRGAPPRARAKAVLGTLSDPRGYARLGEAHCALAVQLAEAMGLSAAVSQALGAIYERWDGRGVPRRLQGEAVPLPARVLHLAWTAEVHRQLGGPAAAVEHARRQSGRALAPELSRCFLQHADRCLEGLDAASVWDRFLEEEPLPTLRARKEPPAIARAFGEYADLKSPYTLGHSQGVAALAAKAGAALGLDGASLELAGHLHDLGRVSVPNGIWDKRGSLNAVEWTRVRDHSLHTERIVGFSPLWRRLAPLAGAAHERGDGLGYHRGLRARLPLEQQVLAAADVLHALQEPRPHRPARSASEARDALQGLVPHGVEAKAVDAVLSAAGHRVKRTDSALPAGLSEREAAVLVQLARGLTAKEIARVLDISPRTVQVHTQHVYEKTKVHTRAAAAMFAVKHGLCGPD